MDPLESRIAAFITGQRTEDFGSLILAVHEFQRAVNPAYGRYCNAFPPATTWQQIPALPQRVFKQTAVRCFPETEITATFRTSGTTGEGYGEHHFKSLELYRLAATHGWADAGLSDHSVISLIPPVADSPHSSLSQMADWLADTPMGSDWPTVAAASSEWTAPVTLFGTALAFLDWFEHLGDRQLTLPRAPSPSKPAATKARNVRSKNPISTLASPTTSACPPSQSSTNTE